ncbi:MAG TPA: LysM peptidoglycan-binding domain-containing protein, partial [Polyangiaceae bacterium]
AFVADDKALVHAGRSEHSVSRDAARFCTTVPPESLKFAIWREAARLSRSGFTLQKLDAARLALRLRFEERSVEGRAQAHLEALAFEPGWPAAHAVIPAPDVVERYSLGEVRRFHRRHYRTNFAALGIAGGFDAAQALAWVREYLGDGAFRGPENRPVAIAPARQTSPRLVVLEQPELKNPAAIYGWRIPPLGSNEHRTFELLAAMLASSEGAPLVASLVKERGKAESVRAEVLLQRGAALFQIRVEGASRSEPDDAQKILLAALARFRYSGPSPQELEAARRQLEVSAWGRIESPLGLSRALGEAELFGDSLETLYDPMRAYGAIDAASVRDVVTRFLDPQELCVVEQYPKDWYDPGQVPLPRFHVVSRGETLIGIASRHGVSVAALVKQNKIDPKRPIFPGQKLKLPPGAKPARGTKSTERAGSAATKKERVHVVRKGDTLSEIALRHKVSVREIVRQNGLNPKRPIRIGQRLVIPP